MPSTGSVAAVLDHARRDVGVVVLHGDGGQVELGGELARQVLGVQVVGDDLRRDAVQRAQVADRLGEGPVGGEVLQVADVMARHHPVVVGHADRALQLGPDGEHSAAGRRTAAAAVPARTRATAAASAPCRLRHGPRSRRSGCGSPRSCDEDPVDERRRASMAASSSSWAIGSSLALPLVITSGRPTPASTRWWSGLYGSITPSSGDPGATSWATPAPTRRGTSTIGRRGDSSASSAAASNVAQRLGLLADRRPSPRTASRPWLCDGAARRPHRRRSRRRRGGSRRSPSAPRPPVGGAHRWRRRAPDHRGSWPRREAAARSAWDRSSDRRWVGRGTDGRPDRRTPPGSRCTSRNRAIVVAGRSYGTPSTIVYRGPQLVQLVNG